MSSAQRVLIPQTNARTGASRLAAPGRRAVQPAVTTVFDAMQALKRGPLDVSEVSDEVLAYFARPILPNLRGVEKRGNFLYAPRSLRCATAQ